MAQRFIAAHNAAAALHIIIQRLWHHHSFLGIQADFRDQEKILVQLPLRVAPVLRKAPRSREMLRMQFEVVNHTRRYCTVPGGLWLQSWLLWRFPQTYSRLRDMKG